MWYISDNALSVSKAELKPSSKLNERQQDKLRDDGWACLSRRSPYILAYTHRFQVFVRLSLTQEEAAYSKASNTETPPQKRLVAVLFPCYRAKKFSIGTSHQRIGVPTICSSFIELAKNAY